jgi:hypothetical protein
VTRGNPPLATRGTLRWSRRQVAFTGATVDLGGAHARGDARYDLDGRTVSVRADRLALSPDLVKRLVGRRPRGPWVGRVAASGTRDNLALTVHATTHLGPMELAARLRSAGSRFDFSGIDLRLGGSHLRGAAQLEGGRLTASLDELWLPPTLIHQLAPALDPAWPIRARGALYGRLPALELALAVDAGPSIARVRGRVDARQFWLAAHLDNFELAALQPSGKRVRASLELAANGRFEKGGAVGTLTIRNARGYMLESPFYRGQVDARLDGRGFRIERAQAEIPGAKLSGEGHGAIDEGLEIKYGVVITNALALRHVPEALRVIIGINALLPGRSVVGSIVKRPGEKVQLTYHVLPIGIAQLEFMFRVITGRRPRFERR